MEPRLREMRDRASRERKLFDYALRLEGLLRHASKHAAGIVIATSRWSRTCRSSSTKTATVMTQFAGPDIEAVGLIKFDFLGLKTLTLLADIVRRIASDDRASRSISPRCRSTTRRPTGCSPRPTRSASSRWKAAACASC